MESFDNDYMPHQRQCLEAIRGEYSKKSPIISFKLCTGSGKTRIILRIPSLCQTKRNVFIFPTIALIDQFKKDYLDEFTQFFKNWHEVSTNGISDRKLKKILAQKEFCIVTTYLSLPKVLSESKYIDALIFDEAHHVGAPGCDNAIAENMSKIGCQFRASATPKDDEDNCFTYSFAQAVKDGRCRDYNIYSFIKKIRNEHELSQYLLDHLVKTGNGRVMAFTRWTEADREDSTSVHKFYDAYYRSITDCGGWIRKITAETSSQERTAILTEFDAIPDGRLALLVSCKTINEGVDSRNANVAFFVDTDKSTVTIIQRIGRATRPYRLNGQLIDDQRPGTVMVGMYISIEKYEGKTPEQIDELLKQEMSENGDFGPIFRVLAALKQSDPETYQRCINYPHFQKLQQKVETETSYELYDVPRDGNCFFHCLALHTDSDADELRQDVCDHLEENLDKYEEFGIDEEDVELLREDGEWCSGVMDVAVKAAADMLGKRISVHHPDGQVDTVGDDDCKEGDKINVLLDGNHYSVLLEKGIEKDTPKIKKFRDEEKDGNDENEKKKKRGGKIMLDIDPSFKILFGLNKSASLVEDFTARIDISIENDGKTLEEHALEKANEYVEWFKENGRLAVSCLKSNKKRTNSTEEQKKEHSLASWLSHAKDSKKGYGHSKLYPSVENLLIKTFGEEWYENRDLEMLQIKKANEYVEWFNENGIHPVACLRSAKKRKNATKEQEKEYELSLWFGRTKVAKKTDKYILYTSVENILVKNFGEEWYENRDLEMLQIKKANEYVEWFNENGIHPVACLRSKTKREKATKEQEKGHLLSIWFGDMKFSKKNMDKNNKKCTAIYPSVESILVKNFGEKWYENRDLETLSMYKAKEYIDFCKKNNKHPSHCLQSKDKKKNATEAQKNEHSLAKWFGHMKNDGNKIYPSVEKLLIETCGKDWKQLNSVCKIGCKEEKNEINVDVKIKECPHVKTSGKNKGQICGKRLKNGKDRCAEHSGKKSPSVSSVSSESSVSSLDDKVQKKPTTFTPSKSKTTESNGLKQAPVYSRHSMILKEYKVMHSRTLAKRFHENRKEWHDYHALAEENEKGFGEDVPYRRIISYLEKTLPPRKKKTVVDMGCGLARVAKAFSGRKNIDFINIDHVACDESVVEGDISHTGLDDGEADVAVLCLAMWGSNKEEYIKEAYRILDAQGGRLLIIEPVKKWLREDGSHSLRDLLVSTGFTIRVEEVKMGEDSDKYHKFSMFVAEK